MSQESLPAVSFVVPVLGPERHLGDCLGSLVAQSYSDIEIIVVAANEDAAAPEFLHRLVQSDARIRVVRHESGGGPVEVRATGVRQARGTYTAAVLADDELEPWFVEDLLGRARRDDVDLAQCATRTFPADGGTDVVTRRGDTRLYRRGEGLRAVVSGAISTTLTGTLIRTSLWQSLSASDERSTARLLVAADLATVLAAVQRAASIVTIPQVGYRSICRPKTGHAELSAEEICAGIEDLDQTFTVVRALLTQRPQPAHSVAEFFERNFANVVCGLLADGAAATGFPKGLPTSPPSLGLLAAAVQRSVLLSARRSGVRGAAQ